MVRYRTSSHLDLEVDAGEVVVVVGPSLRRAAAQRPHRGGVLGGRYPIPVYTAIAVVYIAVNAYLSFLARWLDRRTRRKLGRTMQPSVADEAA